MKHEKRMAQTAPGLAQKDPESCHLSCHARGTHKVPLGQALLHTKQGDQP